MMNETLQEKNKIKIKEHKKLKKKNPTEQLNKKMTEIISLIRLINHHLT